MTPDLDQTLSLKASLVDDVSPKLEQIDKAAKTTREAVQEMADASDKAGKDMGSATSGMADSTDQASRRMKGSLDEAGSAFKDFGSAAEEGSKQAGKALEDALYTGQSSSKLNALDKDLGNLNKTFSGMASTQRVTQGRARNLRAVSQDSINKKLIPAFQELHSTLDEYPDTLEKINRLEQDRMDMLGSGGYLEGIKSRMGQVGEAVEDAKFGVEKAMAVITTGVAGVVGLQVEEQQRAAARLGGVAEFQELPNVIEKTLLKSRAPISEFEGAMQSLLEFNQASLRDLPDIVSEMVTIQKATGLAGSEVAGLYDQLVSLGSLEGGRFTELVDDVKFFAESSRASIEEMAEVLVRAGETMIRFAGDARKAYAESTLAAGAAAREMGIAAETPMELLEKARTDPQVLAKLEGLIQRTGAGVTARELVMQGDAVRLMALSGQGAVDQMGGNPLLTPEANIAFQSMLGDVFNEQTYQRMREAAEGDPQHFAQSFMKIAQDMQAGAGGAVADSSGAIRGTMTEQFEQMSASVQAAFTRVGTKMLQLTEQGTQALIDLSYKGVESFLRMDDKLGGMATDIAALGMAARAVFGMVQVFGGLVSKIPVIGKPLGGMMSSTLGALGITTALGVGGISSLGKNDADTALSTYDWVDKGKEKVSNVFNAGDTTNNLSSKTQATADIGTLRGDMKKFYGKDKGRKAAKAVGDITGKRYMRQENAEGAGGSIHGMFSDKELMGYKDPDELYGLAIDAAVDEAKGGFTDAESARTFADKYKGILSPEDLNSIIGEQVKTDEVTAEEGGGRLTPTLEELRTGKKPKIDSSAIVADATAQATEDSIAASSGDGLTGMIDSSIKTLSDTLSQDSVTNKEVLETMKAQLETSKAQLEAMQQVVRHTVPDNETKRLSVKPLKPYGVDNSEAFLEYDAGR